MGKKVFTSYRPIRDSGKTMDQQSLKQSAQFIAKNNVDDGVDLVIVTFDHRTAHLKVVFCLNREPTENDWENCELTCAELISDFTDIKTAETKCQIFDKRDLQNVDSESIVFSRDQTVDRGLGNLMPGSALG